MVFNHSSLLGEVTEPVENIQMKETKNPDDRKKGHCTCPRGSYRYGESICFPAIAFGAISFLFYAGSGGFLHGHSCPETEGDGYESDGADTDEYECHDSPLLSTMASCMNPLNPRMIPMTRPSRVKLGAMWVILSK